MSQYPEHDKLEKVADESQSIGDFLDWLQNDKRCIIGQFHRHDDDCQRETMLALDGNCGYQDLLLPIRERAVDLLAEYFGIDNAKIDAEKRDMLERLKQSQ